MKLPFKEGDICVFKELDGEVIGIVDGIWTLRGSEQVRMDGYYTTNIRKYLHSIFKCSPDKFIRLANELDKCILAMYDGRVFANVKYPSDYDLNKAVYIKDKQGNVDRFPDIGPATVDVEHSNLVLPHLVPPEKSKSGYCHEHEKWVMGIDPTAPDSDQTSCHIVYKDGQVISSQSNIDRLPYPDLVKEMVEVSRYYDTGNIVSESEEGKFWIRFMKMHDRIINLKGKSKLNTIKYRRK